MATKKENEQSRITELLVDADLLIYRCGFAADAEAKRKVDRPEDYDYEEWALGNARTTIEGILSRFPQVDNFSLHLSGPSNYREGVCTILPYKGNRDPNHKPKYYEALKLYLRSVWQAETHTGMEADDALGIRQWARPDKTTCIVSVDKDMKTIPGWNYNWVKDDLSCIKLVDANKNFYRQMLEGDRVDNIPGIRGVGPKTVDKLLTECGDDLSLIKDKVVEYYKKQYKDDWQSAYDEVATLLFILREEGKSFKDYGL